MVENTELPVQKTALHQHEKTTVGPRLFVPQDPGPKLKNAFPPEKFSEPAAIWSLDQEGVTSDTPRYLILKEPLTKPTSLEKTQIYQAWDIHLGKLVAMKVDKKGKSAEKFSSVQQEAVTLANLEHKNILPVYQFFSSKDAFNYSNDQQEWNVLVMEYQPTESTLKDWIEKGTLPSNQIPNIIEQIAIADEFMIRNGILHRDLKPSNIFIKQNADGTFWVQVADLDLATPLIETEDTRTISDSPAKMWLSRLGEKEFEIVGTPHYLTPERITAPNEYLQTASALRSDTHVLANMTYEMITDTPLFGGYGIFLKTLQVISQFNTLSVEHITILTNSLAEKGITNHQQQLAIFNVVSIGLRKKPHMRYSNPLVFAQALKQAFQPTSSD